MASIGLQYIQDPTLLYTCQKQHQQQQTATLIYHANAIYVPVTNMLLQCHIYKLGHGKIGDNYDNIYASNELTAINSMNNSTHTYPFHIISM